MTVVPDPYDPAVVGGGPEGVDRRQAWIAVDYVGLLAAQAGYPWNLIRAETDVHSLDGTVTVHPGGSVFVQVKGRRPHFPRSTSYSIRAAWRKNWSALRTPGYFVVVTVPDDLADGWVQHPTATHDTHVRLSAYWTRIDPLGESAKSIQVHRRQRLTMGTFEQWRRDYLDSTSQGFAVDRIA